MNAEIRIAVAIQGRCPLGHSIPLNPPPEECPTCRELRLQEEQERQQRLARKQRRQAREARESHVGS